MRVTPTTVPDTSSKSSKAEAKERPERGAKAAKQERKAPATKTEKDGTETAKKASGGKQPERKPISEKKDEVILSAKGKAASDAERQMTQAETLMEHVTSGNLSPEERELAMGRVGSILKKYGHT